MLPSLPGERCVPSGVTHGDPEVRNADLKVRSPDLLLRCCCPGLRAARPRTTQENPHRLTPEPCIEGSITLFSEPGHLGYTRVDGPHPFGVVLRLPDPFHLDLDTSGLSSA